jgi:hypothetical protein
VPDVLSSSVNVCGSPGMNMPIVAQLFTRSGLLDTPVGTSSFGGAWISAATVKLFKWGSPTYIRDPVICNVRLVARAVGPHTRLNRSVA